MALITEIRNNVTEATPLMAMVGATDYAVEHVRSAAHSVGHLPEEIKHLPEDIKKAQAEFRKALSQLESLPKEWQARLHEIDAKSVQSAPGLIVHRVKDVAGRVEESYSHLAERGKDLIDRAGHTPPAQDFVKQGKVTLSRTRAVVTSARKVIDDSAAAARSVITVGRREAVEVASAVEAEVAEGVRDAEKAVVEHSRGTRAAIKDAATTVRKRAASTRKATRSAATSARKAARKAVDAVEAVAEQIGEVEEAPMADVEPIVAPAAEAPAPAKRATKRAAKAEPVDAAPVLTVPPTE